MGIKGELVDGFPQLKPAFVMTFDWSVSHNLGPTTHPQNHLNYVKLRGTVKSVSDSSLPPFSAEFVDGGSWIQEEVLASGEVWMKAESFALLRVVEPPNTSADPAVETGLIRLKWNSVGYVPQTIKPGLARDIPELIRIIPTVNEPGATVTTLSFHTGDQRYKYLEHAVYVGKTMLVHVPPEDTQEEHNVVMELKISYLAA